MRMEGPRYTEPPSGSSSPMTIFRKVDLPVPLSPSRAMRSPPATSRSRSENRVRAPKDLLRWSTIMASSPKNSRSPKRVVSFLSLVGRSVVRMRSMRFSMDLARL